jgi:phosphonatase-like hydrolase
MLSATRRVAHAARPSLGLSAKPLSPPLLLARGFGSGNRPLPVMSEMGIKLVVCDMAGTTVEEHGIVYKTLRQAMIEHGLTVSEAEMHPWHGAAKGAVTAHFLDREPGLGVTAKQIDHTFEELVTKAYAPPGATDLICPNLREWISQCKAAGIKVGLNTGYPVVIQEGLLADLKLDTMVDCWVSASQVAEGRPYPYMVHRLMEQMGILDCSSVAKFGDTVNDIREGKNAGCGLVVGVLSGADSALDLYEAGADIVVPNVTHIQPGISSKGISLSSNMDTVVCELAAQVAERLVMTLRSPDADALPRPARLGAGQGSSGGGSHGSGAKGPAKHTLAFLRG